MSNRVPVAALAAAIVDTGIPMSEVARNADLMKPDTQRVRVMLGLTSTSTNTRSGERYAATLKTVNYDMAVRLCHAAGLDPVDVGL